MFKVIYLDERLPEKEKRKIEKSYGQYITSIKDMAVVIVSNVERAYVDELGRLILPPDFFYLVIDDILLAITNNSIVFYKLILDAVVNNKIH